MPWRRLTVAIVSAWRRAQAEDTDAAAGFEHRVERVLQAAAPSRCPTDDELEAALAPTPRTARRPRQQSAGG